MKGRSRFKSRFRFGREVPALQRIIALSPSLLIWPVLATMSEATDGTGSAPSAGDPVGRILDLSGNGNNLIAGTWASPSDAARATLTAGGALNFDGSNDYYSLLNAIPISTNMTVVRAFKRTSIGIKSTGIGAAAVAFPRDGLWFTNNAQYVALNNNSQAQNIVPDTSTGSFVYTSRRRLATQDLRRNGAEVIAPATSGALAGNFDTVGRTSTDYNAGEISFLAVFDRELTGDNLSLVEQIAASTNGAVLS